jgi:hypothetical protein
MCKGILLAAAWSGLVLLMVSGTAQAADWRRVGKSNASEDFIDVSSIHVKGSIRTAWFKSTYPPHTAGPNPKRWWRYSETFNSFDCDSGTQRSESLIVYYEDGGMGDPQSYPPTWEPVPPDTMIDLAMRFICAWKPEKTPKKS